ncbi:hypothetical protein [Sutterella sp.]|uniref:hypothetical protein n=1 Tax=Sutterella sp. TaxID=1981025 RepID=UPI0026DFC12D|nr:hypothetical protein [Sutterella sp.]MDO5532748.1 hypothetical protein [Sutterella sp.]
MSESLTNLDLARFPGFSRAEVKDGVCTMHLTVREARQLFATQAPVPAEYMSLDDDVVDFLTDTVSKNRKTCREFELVIHMPAEEVNKVSLLLATDLNTALRAYFDARGEKFEQRLRDHFADARKMLVCGVAFLLACTLLRTYLSPEETDRLQSSMREGLLVIGWVALWKPVEELIFNWWPIDREMKDWRTLADMDMRIEAY